MFYALVLSYDQNMPTATLFIAFPYPSIQISPLLAASLYKSTYSFLLIALALLGSILCVLSTIEDLTRNSSILAMSRSEAIVGTLVRPRLVEQRNGQYSITAYWTQTQKTSPYFCWRHQVFLLLRLLSGLWLGAALFSIFGFAN